MSPQGTEPADLVDEVALFEKCAGALERSRLVTGAHFVRLYGEHGLAT